MHSSVSRRPGPGRVRAGEDQQPQLCHRGALAHDEHRAHALAVDSAIQQRSHRGWNLHMSSRDVGDQPLELHCSSRTRAHRSRRAAAPPSPCRRARGRAAPHAGLGRGAARGVAEQRCTVAMASISLALRAGEGAEQAGGFVARLLLQRREGGVAGSVRRSRLCRASAGEGRALEPARDLEAAQDAAEVAGVQRRGRARSRWPPAGHGAPVRTAPAPRSATGRCPGTGRARRSLRVEAVEAAHRLDCFGGLGRGEGSGDDLGDMTCHCHRKSLTLGK